MHIFEEHGILAGVSNRKLKQNTILSKFYSLCDLKREVSIKFVSFPLFTSDYSSIQVDVVFYIREISEFELVRGTDVPSKLLCEKLTRVAHINMHLILVLKFYLKLNWKRYLLSRVDERYCFL